MIRALLTAGYVGVVALLGWHPEVGGARVKHHFECLRRVADRDRAVVLGLGVIAFFVNNYPCHS